MSQAKHAPTTRRSMLAATLALSTAAGAGSVLGVHKALAAAPHPDAALLALEPEFDRLYGALEAKRAVCERIVETIRDRLGPRPDALLSAADAAWLARAKPIYAELGLDRAEEANDVAWDDAKIAIDRIRAIRPRTLDGLCLHARVLSRFELDPPDDIFEIIIAVHDASMAA